MSGFASYPVVLGIGLRPACPAAQLRALVETVLAEHGVAMADIVGIATIDRRLECPGLVALGEAWGLPITGLSREALAGVADRLVSRSTAAQHHLGVPSVAEAAALVVADQWLVARGGAARAHLLGPRRHDKRASVALARIPAQHDATI